MTDDIPILPYDADSYDPDAPQKPRPAVLDADGFAYIGQALDVAEFRAYVSAYRFGSVLPDFVVLHHTANPDASWAPLSAHPQTKWDRNEKGMGALQVKNKRKRQLDGIAKYYQTERGWNCGPHIFIDERWIWLFTPMHDVGIHAATGNSYKDREGKLHYSIGIEAIGYYERQVWPAAVARNVGMCLAILRKRLGTFSLDYRPGPTNAPQAHAGSLSSHRDFNKPGCPGKAITEQYYTGVAQQAWRELTGAPAAPHAGLTHYKVKDSVTGGATIRVAGYKQAAVLGRLHAGDDFWGELVPGQLVYVVGFGSSNMWCRSDDQRWVWSGLLEVAKES